jgi:DNA-binding NarL/FixJ family response regulator
MDINMSPVNGFEATRKIVSRHPSCRIIGLSLHAVPFYARNLLQLGAKGYVTKSASYLNIIEAIRVVAAGGEFIDQNLRGTI